MVDYYSSRLILPRHREEDAVRGGVSSSASAHSQSFGDPGISKDPATFEGEISELRHYESRHRGLPRLVSGLAHAVHEKRLPRLLIRML
jgi:hypothetical protein